MNVTELKRLADGAAAYGKKWADSRHQQYSHAKTYVDMTKSRQLSAAEYDFVIKRIADRLGI